MKFTLVAIAVVIVGFVVTLAYNRWIRPQMTGRWIERTLNDVRSGRISTPPMRSDLAIAVDDLGFSVSHVAATSTPVASVPWDEVLRVTAFKRDLLTVDCICMAIAAQDGTTVEVNEEMLGWEALTAALASHLPGSIAWSECSSNVAFPAFVANETQVFVRHGPPEVTKCPGSPGNGISAVRR